MTTIPLSNDISITLEGPGPPGPPGLGAGGYSWKTTGLLSSQGVTLGVEWIPYAVNLSAANSGGGCSAPAAVDTTLPVYLSGSIIGSALYRAGVLTPVVTLSTTAIPAKSTLEIRPASVPDANLAGVYITLAVSLT